MESILELIQRLELLPHPEGGFYKETYRSKEKTIPGGDQDDRNISTAIYFLLPFGTFSAFHRIKSDELWHFYAGMPVEVFVLLPNGELDILKLGKNPAKGETFQAVVPAGNWFASRPVGETGYSLVGCTVAPGFDFADFEMAERAALVKNYPQHRILIEELTRMETGQ